MIRLWMKAILGRLGSVCSLGLIVGCGGLSGAPEMQGEQPSRMAQARAVSAPVPITRQEDRLLATLDPTCARMCTTPFRADTAAGADTSYLQRAIGRYVHQIWLGDRPMGHAEETASWQRYAQAFGYRYVLWTERDLTALRALMPARNAALLDRFVAAKEYWGASDLIRLSLLEVYGGIYVDVDVGAPTHEGELIDFAAVMPMQNLALATEFHARNTGNNVALFVGNSLMMACPGHPMVAHWVRTVADNVAALTQQGSYLASPSHMTGPFFINRSLGGAFTVIPITQLDAFGMLE